MPSAGRLSGVGVSAFFVFVCVCVCLCVRACVRACVPKALLPNVKPIGTGRWGLGPEI